MRSYPLVLLFAFVVVSREASADDTQDRKQVHGLTNFKHFNNSDEERLIEELCDLSRDFVGTMEIFGTRMVNRDFDGDFVEHFRPFADLNQSPFKSSTYKLVIDYVASGFQTESAQHKAQYYLLRRLYSDIRLSRYLQEAMTTEWAVDAVRLQKTQMIDWHKRGITLADFVENTNAAYGPGKINWMNPYFSVFVAFARGFEGPPAKYPHLYLLGELAKKNNGLGHVIEKILSASQPKVAGEPAPIPMHGRSILRDLIQYWTHQKTPPVKAFRVLFGDMQSAEILNSLTLSFWTYCKKLLWPNEDRSELLFRGLLEHVNNNKKELRQILESAKQEPLTKADALAVESKLVALKEKEHSVST
ncbi:hypothetical protein Plhal304r1_c019g0068691 [Plasmopara halstedii]